MREETKDVVEPKPHETHVTRRLSTHYNTQKFNKNNAYQKRTNKTNAQKKNKIKKLSSLLLSTNVRGHITLIKQANAHFHDLTRTPREDSRAYQPQQRTQSLLPTDAIPPSRVQIRNIAYKAPGIYR